MPLVVAPSAFKMPMSLDFSNTIMVKIASMLNPATIMMKNKINAITRFSRATAFRNVPRTSSQV